MQIKTKSAAILEKIEDRAEVDPKMDRKQLETSTSALKLYHLG